MEEKGSVQVAPCWLCAHPPPPSSPQGSFPRAIRGVLEGGWDSHIHRTVTSLLGGDKQAVCSAKSVPLCDLVWLCAPSLQTQVVPSQPPLSTPVHVHVICRHRAGIFIYIFPFPSAKHYLSFWEDLFSAPKVPQFSSSWELLPVVTVQPAGAGINPQGVLQVLCVDAGAGVPQTPPAFYLAEADTETDEKPWE